MVESSPIEPADPGGVDIEGDEAAAAPIRARNIGPWADTRSGDARGAHPRAEHSDAAASY